MDRQLLSHASPANPDAQGSAAQGTALSRAMATRLIAEQPITVVAHLAVLAVMLFPLWTQASHTSLLLWAGAITLAVLARGLVFLRGRAIPDPVAALPALRLAILASEDKRFHEHSGVDWRAASSAAWGNLWNTRTRGASTITMQLAGLLEDDLRQSASQAVVSLVQVVLPG